MGNKTGVLKVSIAGDLCMRNLMERIDDTYAKGVLKDIQPILDKGDFKLVNLENAVIAEGTPIDKSGPPLKALPENLVFLKQGGFDCAILANNHIGDYGEEGVLSTLYSLDEAGIAYIGAGENIGKSYEPGVFEVNGCRLGVIALCENEFGVAESDKAGVAGFDLYRALHAIKAAKENADFVLVVMHGGCEYYPLPSPGVVSRYRTFVDLGADAVIGMHPHCIQGYEVYQGAPIVYSTGNFLFYKTITGNPKSSWYYGYIPLLTFEKGSPVVLDIFPYRFDEACTLISPFEGEDKEAMLAYLKEISKPIGDMESIKRYFLGWCVISGIPHGDYMHFKREYLEEPSFPTGHPMLPLRNILTCEAHNELMAAFFKMLVDGKMEMGKHMVEDIVRMQKMPI